MAKRIGALKIMLLFATIFLATISDGLAQYNGAEVKVDLAKTFQTIDNFGASDAWSCQFIGNWPDKKRNQIADLLFSLKTKKDGSPIGIGLSLWRFNLGAGSEEQGENSGIKDAWRRGASFLKPDGSYDWKAASGQLWFLKVARKRGVESFLAFSNSAPVQFTRNGKAFSNDGKVNIDAARYQDFGNYLADVIKGVAKNIHVKFDYISPVNEPEWDWKDGGQEGCPYTNTEIAGLVKAINQSFVKAGLNTKILVGEAGKIDYLFKAGDKPGKGHKIEDFFYPGSGNYIGDLPAVSKAISAHSYFTTSPAAAAIALREELRDSVKAVNGLTYWQSEYCILGDNNGEIDGNKRDLSMAAALYMATVIHRDLTVADAAAWQWWTAVSPYNYKDGLVYIDKNRKDGDIYPSKMLWVLGNYSRFIRPGAVRVKTAVSSVDSTAGKQSLLACAFKKGKDFTAILINRSLKKMKVRLNFESQNVEIKNIYITSSSDALRRVKVSGNEQNLPAASVVTITGRIQ